MLAALAVAVLVGVSCDTGPKEGELQVELATPNANDGVILFRVTAVEPDAVIGATGACAGCQAFVYNVTDADMLVAVTGSLTNGPIARVMVSDVGAKGYMLSVVQVAGQDRGLRSNTGYALTLRK
jgi:hypothetical protein